MSCSPHAQPSRRSALCPLLLVAALLTTLGACDSLDTSEHKPAPATDAALGAARAWFDSQTASLAKNGDDALRRFYPDWSRGTLVIGANGRRAVVTTLWRDYPVTYDSTLYFLRVLAVVLDGKKGSVASGHILEFASPARIAPNDGSRLVAQWLSNVLNENPMWVVERGVTNEVEQARLFVPGRAPIEGRHQIKECEAGLGKAMAVQQCDFFDVYTPSGICTGPMGNLDEICGWTYSVTYQ